MCAGVDGGQEGLWRAWGEVPCESTGKGALCGEQHLSGILHGMGQHGVTKACMARGSMEWASITAWWDMACMG